MGGVAVLQRAIKLVHLGGRLPRVDNSAKRLNECEWSLGLKDILPHVDTCGAVAESAMSHRQSVEFRNFLTPRYHHWDRAGT